MTPSWRHNACSSLLGTREKLPVWSESAPLPLPVTQIEGKREGKNSISPWMKYGHANLSSFCSYTNGGCSIIDLSFLSLCICPSYQFVSFHLFHKYYLSVTGRALSDQTGSFSLVPKSELHASWRHDSIILKGGHVIKKHSHTTLLMINEIEKPDGLVSTAGW